MNNQFSDFPTERKEKIYNDFLGLSPEDQQMVLKESAEEQPAFLEGLESYLSVPARVRLVAKNFSNSPKAMQAYLAKEGFDTQEHGGEISYRRKGFTGGWDTLDPDLSFSEMLSNPSEVAKDIGDVLGDVGVGTAATVGGILGAVGLGGLTGGAGAVPGAMAGSAAFGGGAETARQGVGQFLGIPQDMDWGQVGTTAALSGVSPLLFGTGAGGIAAAGPKLSQRGIISRGGSRLLSGLSGVPHRAIETGMARTDELVDMLHNGVKPKLNELTEQIATKISPLKSQGTFGNAADEAIDEVASGVFTRNKASYPKLWSLFNEGKRDVKESMKNIDATYDTNILDTAELMDANRFLGEGAKILPLTGPGLIPRNPLALAGKIASPFGMFVGPKATQLYLRGGRAMEDLLDPLGSAPRAAANSAWMQLKGE